MIPSPSPPLLAAVAGLRAQGLVGAATAAFLARVARGELVSVRRELQLGLWGGVTLIAAGAGLLVKEHLERLGPLTIACGIGLAAALCLWHVSRLSAPFSWGAVPSPTLAFDYVLLLGLLLLGTDLAYVEARFKILGPNWPWHLLLLSLLQLGFAFRYDSRAVLSLALASFAAWRGVALSFPDGLLAGSEEIVRVNALAVGALYLAAGVWLKQAHRKAHFEPLFGNLGLLLVLGAAVSGIFADDVPGFAWTTVLALAAAATIALAFRARRPDYFAQGVVAAALGLLRLVLELGLGEGVFYLVSAGSFATLFLILWARRRFREER